MELNQGFKQTEVGVIPNDWHLDTLGKISFVTKLAGFEYSLHFNSYKDEGEIIVVRGTNITHNRLDLSDVKTIPSKTSKNLLRSKLFKNDLVFAYVGTIGPVYLIEEDDRFHLGPNTAKITVNKHINSKYLNHYFKSSILKKEIIELTSIGAQPSLSMTKIRSFKIIIPPIPEQIAIATALSNIDELISQTEKLIEKKKVIKQGVIQELLKPKDGWVLKKLGDVCDVLDHLRKPLNDSERQTIKGDIPYCGANGIVGFVNDFVIDDDIILMAEDGGYFDEYITRPIAYQMNGKCWVNNHAHILKSKKGYDQNFIFYSLVNKNILDYINGGTRAKLNKGEMVNIVFSIPQSILEQTKIAKVFIDLSQNIAIFETKLTKLKYQKQGMMQALLTGKIRLI